MTEPLALELVEAIAGYLEALHLPSHTLIKHRRPVAVMPEDCPVLCVWYQESIFAPLTTMRYDRRATVGVSWQEAAVNEARTLVLDNALSQSMARNLDLIEQCLIARSLHEQPLEGVDRAWGMFPLSTNYAPGPELETGLVEGYIVTVQVSVVDSQEGS